jgi:adenosylcobinamide-phosphate synthase
MLAFLALLIELMLGYPDWLFRAIGHPVTWIGRLVDKLELLLNCAQDSPLLQRTKGMIAVLILIAVVGVIASLIALMLGRLPFGSILIAALASTLLAQRSLYRHVADVAAALERGGLGAGRKTVARIVGRDPQALDEAGVARAAIESLAENFADGVVAPALWMAIAGLPGAAIYKAINTADSMIGHRTLRFRSFGFAAARVDDLVNLPASRAAALLIMVAAALNSRAAAAAAWHAVRRDAPRHRSPNAGYPEAAMAGALGLALAGPRQYEGVLVDDAFMGDGRREATAADIRAALSVYRRADAMLIGVMALIAVLVSALG